MEGSTVVLHNTVLFRHSSGRTKNEQYNFRHDNIFTYTHTHIYIKLSQYYLQNNKYFII
jgi:hypothetical protein